MAAILPRHVVHQWRPLHGHVPPMGLFQGDAHWYRHRMRLRRDDDDEIVDLDPLVGALDDLEDWVREVLPRVPHGYTLYAYFDVVGTDDEGEEMQARVERRPLGVPGWRQRLENDLEELLNRGSERPAVLRPTALVMFATVVRGAMQVTLEGWSEEEEDDDDEGERRGAPSRGRPGPRRRSPEAGPSRQQRKAASTGRRGLVNERQLFGRASGSFSS